MGFAEEFEKNKKTFVIVAVLVVIAIVVSVMTLTSGPKKPSKSEGSSTPKLFYTVDDGKTWFEDDAAQLPPFDHGGKPAYRVQVYKCGADGSPFVAYMQRIEEGARKAAEAAKAAGKRQAEIEELWINKVEVKKPGETKWVPTKGAEKIMTVTCPEGKIPLIVLPGGG
jgi:hypothetical protein